MFNNKELKRDGIQVKIKEPEFELLGISFGELFIKREQILARNWSYPSSSSPSKMTEEWGEIQGKWDLVRVNGDAPYPSSNYRGSTVLTCFFTSSRVRSFIDNFVEWR